MKEIRYLESIIYDIEFGDISRNKLVSKLEDLKEQLEQNL